MQHYTFKHTNHYPAWLYMHEGLGEVRRFLGVPYIPDDKKETTKAHVENTGKRAHELFIKTINELGLHTRDQMREAHGLKRDTEIHISLHDGGEIIIEPMTAIGETDSVIQQQLSDYNPAEVEARICGHFYRHALTMMYEGKISDFYDYVHYARQKTIPTTHASGQMTPEDILSFYKGIDTVIGHTEKGLSKNRYWSCKRFDQTVAEMMQTYSAIENETCFSGTLGKVLEKMDGSAYVVTTLDQLPVEKRLSIPGKPTINMLGRYEGRLHTLFTQAGENILCRHLARNAALECVQTSIGYLRHVPDPIPVASDIMITPKDALTFYTNKYEQLKATPANDLKPSDFTKGKSLLHTHALTLVNA